MNKELPLPGLEMIGILFQTIRIKCKQWCRKPSKVHDEKSNKSSNPLLPLIDGILRKHSKNAGAGTLNLIQEADERDGNNSDDSFDTEVRKMEQAEHMGNVEDDEPDERRPSRLRSACPTRPATRAGCAAAAGRAWRGRGRGGGAAAEPARAAGERGRAGAGGQGGAAAREAAALHRHQPGAHRAAAAGRRDGPGRRPP